MIRLAAIAVLCSTVVADDSRYVPFDYSKTFQQPESEPEPTPAKQFQQPPAQPPLTQPEPARDPAPEAERYERQPAQPTQPAQPDTSVLDLDDLREMIDERLEPSKPEPREPAQSPAELPQKVAPGQQPQRRHPVLGRKTQHGRPQVVVLTSCSWNERDLQGRFVSHCGPCNAGNTAIAAFVAKWDGKYTAGPYETDDFYIVDITTPAGREIDLAMGGNGYSLTELVAKANPDINKYTPATPVFVTRYPDREPQIRSNWPEGLDPASTEATWWLWELFGADRDKPQTWGTPNADWHALAMWIQSGPGWQPTHTRGWGATIPASDLIDLMAPGGKRQIYGDTYLVVPQDFRPRITGSRGNYRIEFGGTPYVEYKFGFLNRRANLSHATVADDFSRITVHAEGYRATFTLNIDLREN